MRVGGRAWYLDFDEDGEFYDRSADGLGVAVLYRLKFREDRGAEFDVDDFGF